MRLGGSPNFEGVLVSPLRPVVGPAACFGGQTRAHDALEVADSLSGRLSANANENSHLRPLLSPPRGSLIPYLFIYLCFHANCRSLFALLVQPPSFRTYLRSTIGSHSRHLSPLLALYGARLRFLSRQESSIFFPRRLASNREYTRCYYGRRHLLDIFLARNSPVAGFEPTQSTLLRRHEVKPLAVHRGDRQWPYDYGHAWHEYT